jgi:hypothetical protein
MQSSLEMVTRTRQVSRDLSSLLDPLMVSHQEEGTTHNTHREVLQEVMKLLEELNAFIDPDTPPHHSHHASSSPAASTDHDHHDKRVQDLLRELHGISPNSANAKFDPNNLSTVSGRHLSKLDWDDNTMFPLSAEQNKQRMAVQSLRILTALFASIEQLLVLRFQNLNGRVSDFELKLPGSTLSGGTNLPLFLSPQLTPEVRFRLGQVVRHK